MYSVKVKGSFLPLQMPLILIYASALSSVDGTKTELGRRSLSGETIVFISGKESLYFSLQPLSKAVPITIYMEETTLIVFNYSIWAKNDSFVISSHDPHTSIFVSVDDDDKVELSNTTAISIKEESGNFTLDLEGKLPGRTTLSFKFRNSSEEINLKIYIELKKRTIDLVFNVVVIMLVVLVNVGMGAKVDLQVVKAELKRPIAPIIGLCSQFIFMPLIAFTLVYNLDLDPGVALGFFALGCSPGGSASNAYAYLLNGNINLSVTMTLISTLAALGFLPMWLFTLGRLIYDKGNIKIPYGNVFYSLIGLLAPVGVGLFLQWKFPPVAKYFIKSVKYFVIIFFIFVFSVGIYANWFIFLLISWEVIVASALLPYLGFVFGGVLGLISRQPKANVIAIAIETGIQNTGIPIILLRLSLSGPDKDTGIVTPVVSAILTPIPIMIAIAFVQGKAWWLEKRRREKCLEGEELDVFPGGSMTDSLNK